MSNSVSLRRCGVHEDCQLESVNGGEWEHTPAKRQFRERLEPVRRISHVFELEDRLQGFVRAAGNERARLRDDAARFDEIVRKVETLSSGLAQLQGQVSRELPLRLTESEQRAAALEERSERLAGIAQRVGEAVATADKLARVEELHLALLDLREQIALQNGALVKRLDGLEHNVKHEREERLQDTLKVQRQFREVNRG